MENLKKGNLKIVKFLFPCTYFSCNSLNNLIGLKHYLKVIGCVSYLIFRLFVYFICRQ